MAGVDKAVVSRFLAGTRGLTLDSADRIALALGLRLVEVARAAQRRAAPRPRRDEVPGPTHEESHAQDESGR